MLCLTRDGGVTAFRGGLRTGQPFSLLTLRVKSRTTIGSVVGLLIPASTRNTTLALWSLPSTTPSSCQMQRLVNDSISSFGLFSFARKKRKTQRAQAHRQTITQFKSTTVVAGNSNHPHNTTKD